jgi:hypothetical protein
VAPEFPFLPGGDLAFLFPAATYVCLIAVIALTAVFSSKPARRKAALEVLRLLLPGRKPNPFPSATRRRREPPAIDPPNP